MFDDRFLYIANAGSASISGFQLQPSGKLKLLNASGVSGRTGAHPADMTFSHDGRRLFSLNNGDGTISGFMVKSNGQLGPDGSLSGLPNTSAGLAGW